MEEKNNTEAMGIAGLVLGIISIISCLFWYIALPTGILGIIFGAKASKRAGKALAKAGLVTGIIGLSLCIFIYVSLIMILMIEAM